jgi:hypothetical protein
MVSSETGADSLSELERLVAIEAIKQLKARYLRCVDTQQFDELAALFTPDATVYFPEAGERPTPLSEAMIGIRRVLEGAVSVHHACLPEIEITGPDTARGIWSMHDHLFMPPTNVLNVSELTGAGHYHETYERRGGRWLIQSLKLTRLRVATVSLPKRVM